MVGLLHESNAYYRRFPRDVGDVLPTLNAFNFIAAAIALAVGAVIYVVSPAHEQSA